MTINLDNLTGNETPEELEALLDSIDGVLDDDSEHDDDDIELDDEGSDGRSDTDSADSDDADSATAQDEEQQEQQEEQKPKGVAAKDGEHVIPYDVLERERQEKQQLKEQLETMQKKQSDWEQSQRLLELRNKQLEKLGVEPEDLPENLSVSDEQLEALMDDYPEIGKILKVIVAKTNANQAASQEPTEPVISPVVDVIEQNADLSAWRDQGGESWNKAVEIDEQLRADPQWADKPLAERFAEVVSLTKAAMLPPTPDKAPELSEQDIKAKAEEVESKAKSTLPSSPSAIGSTSKHQPSELEQLANADAESLMAMMQGKSQAEIEALLDMAGV
ncbi:hypothetical protein [Vibrio metschnikovii]|uniref:hypothetical protein n=1 Tax=Vibrio metschnikovii TaxID=28172 RepID=UPI001C30E1C3|nr:hypothetical protein [Vibrio metschnikovii]EKO3566630.1 hypothetical protein [Vibrio metschnikovii]EKO3769013.1 hypothetical protein [Vibrio metschnikovii]EKO3771485.1 hypothetical protein [Vibrio metschnikovii]